jgi:exonuclease VII large subunit
VAEALIEKIRVLDNDLALASERLVDVCSRHLELAQRSILQHMNGLQQGSRKHLEICSGRFQGQVLKVEASLEGQISGQLAHLGKCLVQLQGRARGMTELMEQALESASSRVEEGVRRRLQLAEERHLQNLIGLIEGTRKHLAFNEERFGRLVLAFKGALQRTFDWRLGQLTTKSVRLQEKSRGNQERNDRDLNQRKALLLAAFDRTIQGRNHTLALKTSRFNVAQYERILQQLLKNLEEKRKRVDNLRPEKLLARGYSLTRDEKGRILRSANEVETGQTIRTQLANGALASVVTKKENIEHDG